MGLAASEIKNNLEVFRMLLNSTGIFLFWVFNENFELVDTNGHVDSLDDLFEKTGCKEYLSHYVEQSPLPVILYSRIGLLWFAATERNADRTVRRTHVVGPVNSVEAALSDREHMVKVLNITVEMKKGLDRLAKRMPISSVISLVPYAQMLHCCVTGENIARSDVQFQKSDDKPQKIKGKTEASDALPGRDRHITWKLEQAVLDNVRHGNLNYQEDYDRMCSQATGVRVTNQDMLSRGKMSVVTFIGSCVRAAIEGGMTPEAAHTRGDAYLSSLMECTTLGDAKEVNAAMYADFVQSVHKLRTSPGYSKPIQTCCDFIEINAEEDITLAILARRIGYNEYYLARKFKEETGVSIVNYIKNVKVERAKQLLACSSLSIQEISDKLYFCSRGYFSEVFRNTTGKTPGQYREENQRW